MTSTLSIPFSKIITAKVYAIEGGGFWAEVLEFPGCVAYAETVEKLEGEITQAIEDWWAESRLKTEGDAKRLAVVQGSPGELPDQSYPRNYDDSPPPGWTDEDEQRRSPFRRHHLRE